MMLHYSWYDKNATIYHSAATTSVSSPSVNYSVLKVARTLIQQSISVLCLPPAFTLVSCLAYSSTLKMEAICSFEMSVDFQWTTWRYIPEDSIVQSISQYHAIAMDPIITV
jgi:hypothetical protein